MGPSSGISVWCSIGSSFASDVRVGKMKRSSCWLHLSCHMVKTHLQVEGMKSGWGGANREERGEERVGVVGSPIPVSLKCVPVVPETNPNPPRAEWKPQLKLVGFLTLTLPAFPNSETSDTKALGFLLSFICSLYS